MSEVKVNKLTPRTNCGTVTLGDSGDTFTIPSGVTITNSGTASGFGRTGTVDWQTGSIKTATFTAVNGEGYFANTSGGTFTMNLPAGSAGAIVSVVDYTNTFQNNKLTVSPNGAEKIGGIADDASLSTEGQSVTFVYVDSTEGWKNIQDSTSNVVGELYITATVSGACNTLTTVDTDYKVATFVGPGTFCVSAASGPFAVADYVVVAGGGGGGTGDYGGGTGGFRATAGGGAGGFRVFANTTDNPAFASSPANPLNGPAAIPISVQGYPITVGAGGAVVPSPTTVGNSGSNSIFSTITSTGGGGGGADTPPVPGTSGGSGGGSGASSSGTATGAAGNTPPVSPPQGNPGGDGIPSAPNGGSAGGGGGALAAGTDGSPSNNGTNGGAGGVGAGVRGFGTSGVNCGSDYYFSGGGGGGNYADGGTGGGGKAGRGSPAGSPQTGCNATVNTGGGGGGSGGYSCDGVETGGAGGSGIVIIRYKFQ